jgi:hypothetical protein
MSLACKPKNISPTYEELLTQQTTRNLGLSSVFNVNTYVSPCVEDFTSPTYYLSGATKPMTALVTRVSFVMKLLVFYQLI